MFLLESEIAEAAEAFAVKFADIARRRRVLFGSDPFAALKVPEDALRRRLSQSLLNLVLRLREAWALHGGNDDEAARSVANFAGPLRAAAASLLSLEGAPVPSPKEALAQVASSLPGDGLARARREPVRRPRAAAASPPARRRASSAGFPISPPSSASAPAARHEPLRARRPAVPALLPGLHGRDGLRPRARAPIRRGRRARAASPSRTPTRSPTCAAARTRRCASRASRSRTAASSSRTARRSQAKKDAQSPQPAGSGAAREIPRVRGRQRDLHRQGSPRRDGAAPRRP